jgi:DNA polymerase-3 subunit beta
VRVERTRLMRAIKKVGLAVERRNTIPILSNMMLGAGGGLMTLTGTDLDLQIGATLPYEGDGLETTFGAHLGLYGLLRAADRAEYAELSTDGNKLNMEAGRVKGSLHTLPVDDFPALGHVSNGWSAPAGAAFIDALARVSRAMSTEETRYYLNGVFLHHVSNWTYRLVATDGHRLIAIDVPLPDATPDVELLNKNSGGGIIIPRKAVNTLIKLSREARSEPIKLRLGNQAKNTDEGLRSGGSITRFRALIDGDVGVELMTKLIDGTFPDYKRVIPQAGLGENRAKVRTADLKRALGGISGLSTENTRAVKLHVDRGMLALSITSPENGMATIQIDAETSGKGFEIGFNARYLTDVATAGEFTMLEMADAAAPCRVTDPAEAESVGVIMPMRI